MMEDDNSFDTSIDLESILNDPDLNRELLLLQSDLDLEVPAGPRIKKQEIQTYQPTAKNGAIFCNLIDYFSYS